jgi:hypothetical protein
MSTNVPTALANQAVQTAVKIQSAPNEWIATALTVALAAAAVLFVSFLAVVTGLV